MVMNLAMGEGFMGHTCTLLPGGRVATPSGHRVPAS